eukprot:jgi/Tetstr1/429571/TSEL_019471.t1
MSGTSLLWSIAKSGLSRHQTEAVCELSYQDRSCLLSIKEPENASRRMLTFAKAAALFAPGGCGEGARGEAARGGSSVREAVVRGAGDVLLGVLPPPTPAAAASGCSGKAAAVRLRRQRRPSVCGGVQGLGVRRRQYK